MKDEVIEAIRKRLAVDEVSTEQLDERERLLQTMKEILLYEFGLDAGDRGTVEGLLTGAVLAWNTLGSCLDTGIEIDARLYVAIRERLARTLLLWEGIPTN